MTKTMQTQRCEIRVQACSHQRVYIGPSWSRFLAGLLFCFVCAMSAQADVTYIGNCQSIACTPTGGQLLSSATFSLSGSTLTVTLSNNSPSDVLTPLDVLTAVLFNTTHTLTPMSASLGGSTVSYGSIGNAGDGWGYASGLSAHGKNSGISSVNDFAGLSQSDFSPNSQNLGGLDYSILSVGDNAATGTDGVTGQGPLVKHTVQFTFAVADGFSLDELGNSVVFQYGTSLSDPSCVGNISGQVPDEAPVTELLACSSLFFAVLVRRFGWK